MKFVGKNTKSLEKLRIWLGKTVVSFVNVFQTFEGSSTLLVLIILRQLECTKLQYFYECRVESQIIHHGNHVENNRINKKLKTFVLIPK